MSANQTEAFVVHLYDYSETSRIIQFLTAHRGKMSCIAKGVHRKNNPWSFSLDRLNRVEIFYTWKSTREVQTLTEVNLIDSYPELKRDIKKQVLASLILETAFSMTETEQKVLKTYTQVCKAFEHISNSGISSEHAVFLTCCHLWQILIHNGIEPQLHICVRCGKPLKEVRHFSLQGGVVCDNCKSDITLNSEEVRGLQLLQYLEDPLNIPYENKAFLSLFEKKILPFICSFITFHLRHPLKSYNVFQELNHDHISIQGVNHEKQN